jgi:aldehyde:ferredoxin oxidoreductase
VILAPGLLADVGASSGGRASVGGKSPLTGTIKEANVGGVLGGMLARLGLKAVIIEGKATPGTWFTIHLSNPGAQLHPAGDLVGLGTYETVARLRDVYGDKVGIVAIGPAGEMRLTLPGASPTEDCRRYVARQVRRGLGASVKAIVVDAAKAQGGSLRFGCAQAWAEELPSPVARDPSDR